MANTQHNQITVTSQSNVSNISGVHGSASLANWGSLLNTNSVITLDEFLDNNTHVKKYQVYEIDEDLLALSTAWKRLRDEYKNGSPYTPIEKLLDKNLFKHVKDVDHEQAKNIRDYYSKKIMLWKLKGQNLTKFRDDMNTFIHSNGKIFKEDICPLVYRLPEFYEYDFGFDELANHHNKIISDKQKGKVTKNLSLQKTFNVGRKYSKRKEYWFSDEQDNLISISFTSDNPLISLLDLHTQKPITLSGNISYKSRDNVEYGVIEKYSFL